MANDNTKESKRLNPFASTTSPSQSGIQKDQDTAAATGPSSTIESRPREHNPHAKPSSLSSKGNNGGPSDVPHHQGIVSLMVFMLKMTQTSSGLVMEVFFQERDDFLKYYISHGGGRTDGKPDVGSTK